MHFTYSDCSQIEQFAVSVPKFTVFQDISPIHSQIIPKSQSEILRNDSNNNYTSSFSQHNIQEFNHNSQNKYKYDGVNEFHRNKQNMDKQNKCVEKDKRTQQNLIMKRNELSDSLLNDIEMLQFQQEGSTASLHLNGGNHEVGDIQIAESEQQFRDEIQTPLIQMKLQNLLQEIGYYNNDERKKQVNEIMTSITLGLVIDKCNLHKNIDEQKTKAQSDHISMIQIEQTNLSNFSEQIQRRTVDIIPFDDQIRNSMNSKCYGRESMNSECRGRESMNSECRGRESMNSECHGGESMNSEYHGRKSINSECRGRKSMDSECRGRESMNSECSRRESISGRESMNFEYSERESRNFECSERESRNFECSERESSQFQLINSYEREQKDPSEKCLQRELEEQIENRHFEELRKQVVILNQFCKGDQSAQKDITHKIVNSLISAHFKKKNLQDALKNAVKRSKAMTQPKSNCAPSENLEQPLNVCRQIIIEKEKEDEEEQNLIEVKDNIITVKDIKQTIESTNDIIKGGRRKNEKNNQERKTNRIPIGKNALKRTQLIKCSPQEGSVQGEILSERDSIDSFQSNSSKNNQLKGNQRKNNKKLKKNR